MGESELPFTATTKLNQILSFALIFFTIQVAYSAHPLAIRLHINTTRKSIFFQAALRFRRLVSGLRTLILSIIRLYHNYCFRHSLTTRRRSQFPISFFHLVAGFLFLITPPG
nr:hypothetical protein Itr_chr06CG05570 [Ipomoea trifida]